MGACCARTNSKNSLNDNTYTDHFKEENQIVNFKDLNSKGITNRIPRKLRQIQIHREKDQHEEPKNQDPKLVID